MSKTLEQLRAEQARDKALLEQYQHRLERLENRAKYLSKAERTARTHRLIAMNLAKQPCCFAEPQSGSAQHLTAFRHQIIIITRRAAVESIVPERNFTMNTTARSATTVKRKA